MEWILAVLCMIPAAVSDYRDRSVALESCITALMVSAAVLVLSYETIDFTTILVGGSMIGIITVVTWKFAGSGDWWFISGLSMAMLTIDIMAVIMMVSGGMVTMLLCHIMICVRRTDLPFPKRFLYFVKKRDDRFCIICEDGTVAKPDASGMIVYPGLPMVTFLVGAAIITGVILFE